MMTGGGLRQCIIVVFKKIIIFIIWFQLTPHFMLVCLSPLTGALLLQSSFRMVVRIATRLHVLPSSLPTHVFTQK